MAEKTGMDFEDLYFNLEKVFGDGSVSIPILPDFHLDNVVEGSFLLALPSRPKQAKAGACQGADKALYVRPEGKRHGDKACSYSA